jgi:hypothetical protein
MALFVMPMKAAERLSTLRRVSLLYQLFCLTDASARHCGTEVWARGGKRNLFVDVQAQLQVVTWGDTQQRPRVLLHSDTSPGALFNFETALKVGCRVALSPSRQMHKHLQPAPKLSTRRVTPVPSAHTSGVVLFVGRI